MGGSASTSVANDTDEILEVKVEHNGNSSVHLVPAHDSVTVPTVVHALQAHFPGCVIVRVHVPSAVAAGQWHWIKRTVGPRNSVLIRKRETGYVIYQSLKGGIWKIDKGNNTNKAIGF